MARKADPTAGSPLEGFEEAPARGSRKAWLVAGIVVVVLAAAYVGLQALVAGKIASGTTVAGVSVGGLTPAAAQQRLDQQLADRTSSSIEVAANDKKASLDPLDAGLRLDAAATVDGLTGFTLDPSRLVRQVSGSSEVVPVTQVDDEKLASALTAIAPRLAVKAVDGTVSVVDGKAASTPAVDGSRLDVTAAAAVVRDSWLSGSLPLELPTTTTPATIDQTATDAALAQAQTIVGSSVWVEVAGQRAEIPASEIARLTTFPVVDGKLTPTLDPDALYDAVSTRTTKLETKATDARFEFNKKGKPVIRGGKPGTSLDRTALAAAVLQGALSADRTATVALAESQPKSSRADLEKLGVKEKVAEFSTPLTNEPIRTQNLALAAERLTGKLVKPGQTFSVIDAIGPITAATGYKAAHIIENGIFVNGIGGGLSQMATTTYNVGFFAGMIDVEHKPHTYWFSRYPAGREATIYVGSYDMRWRNDSPYGVLMQSWVSGGRLYVAAWSTKYYTVTTTSGPHTNVRAPGVITSSSPQCIPTPAGSSGFTISVSRKVTVTATGEVADEKTNTWTYRPSDQIKCSSGDEKSTK